MRVLALIILLFSAAYTSDMWDLRFSDTVTVDADEIYLSDISVFCGEEEEIADTLGKILVSRAPSPGLSINVKRGLIVALLKANKIENNHLVIPETITCTRKRFEESEDYASLYKKIRGLFPADTELETKSIKLFNPDFSKDITAEINHSYREKFFIDVFYTTRDGYRRKDSFTVYASLEQEVYVATQHMRKGEVFSQNQIALKKMNILSKGLRQYDEDNVIASLGKLCAESVRPGEIITGDMFEGQDAVMMNSLVKCTISSGPVSMNVTGTARQSGKVGEVIEVAVGKKIFRGKICDEGNILLF